ncbi:MAG TPA: hypothetical protein VLT89_00455 [Usitatibacter sp.]|nr:hypothetical protein [Usitatibacter sp.]
MIETKRLWQAMLGVLAAACAATEPPLAQAPAAPPLPAVVAPARDENALAEEARALLAQAETDVQRARARRALWLKAWEDLLAARSAVAARDSAAAIAYAKHSSELAQLGLEQLTYPAIQ